MGDVFFLISGNMFFPSITSKVRQILNSKILEFTYKMNQIAQCARNGTVLFLDEIKISLGYGGRKRCIEKTPNIILHPGPALNFV